MISNNLWNRISGEGNFELLTLLHKVEKREAGYGTVVVPKEGFSDSDDTHNMVLEWLEEHRINVLNVRVCVARMKHALHG